MISLAGSLTHAQTTVGVNGDVSIGIGLKEGHQEVCVDGSCSQWPISMIEGDKGGGQTPDGSGQPVGVPAVSCPAGQIYRTYRGTSGACVPAATPPATGQGNTGDDGGARQRAACVERVRTASLSCSEARNAASASCNPSSNTQLSSLNAEGEQLSRDLQNEATKKAACDRNGDYQQRLGSAIQQFQTSCQQSVTSCSSSCQQIPSMAQGCADDPRVASAVDTSQANGSHCSGSLQTRATQAAQQSGAQSTTAQAAQTCSAVAAASEDAPPTTSSGGEQITPPNSATGMADLTTGPKPDYLAGSEQTEGTLSAATPEGGAKMKVSETSDDLGKSAPNPFENLAHLPTRESYGTAGGFAGSGGGFNGTPGFNNDIPGDASPEARAARAAAILGDSSGSGSGKKGAVRRPVRYSRFGAVEDSGDSRSPASLESSDGSPNLQMFLPQMQRARRIAGMAALGIHSAETNFFSKVHERYVALEHTFDPNMSVAVKNKKTPVKSCTHVVTQSETKKIFILLELLSPRPSAS